MNSLEEQINNDYMFEPTKNIKIKYGKGIYLYDEKGNEYIDCSAGTFNLSLGYSNEEVINFVKQQMDELIHVTSSFATEPIMKLSNKLVELSPKSLTKVHLKVSGGSTANEGAIKMAQYYSKKRDIISMFRSHIGQTIFTMNASGNAFRRKDFMFDTSGILHVPSAYCYRCFYNQKPENCNYLCVERINDFIDFASSGNVAGLIAEPILGNGDNIVPPKKYFKLLRKLCNERGITLIMDEIQTGVGRTGNMFASQTFQVEPDIMTLAKGLGGTGFQVAAILCKEKYTKMNGEHHAFTFGSNVMAASAALKTLEIVSKESFLDNVKEVGGYIISRLKKLQEKYCVIGDVRGVGLMIGIEIIDFYGNPDNKITKVIKNEAFKNKLLLRMSRNNRGNVLKIRPALNITMEEAEELCNRLEKSFVNIFGVK